MIHRLLPLLLAGCVAAAEPDPVSVSGTWAVFLDLDGRMRPTGGEWRSLRCEGGVVAVLDDVAGTVNGGFTKGSLACWSDPDPIAVVVPWASPIEGTREDRGVALDDGWCRYTGTLIAADSMEGQVICTGNGISTELDQTGHWVATK